MIKDVTTNRIPSAHTETREVISKAAKVAAEYNKKYGKKNPVIIEIAKNTWIVREKDDTKRKPNNELVKHLERIGL